MILRAALISAAILATAAPALAQDAETRGMQCATVNALGAEGAVAFFFGYQAGVLDFLDPEGHRAASAPIAPVTTAPENATKMAAACAASPGSSLAQVLATQLGTEDPIDLKTRLLH